MHIRRGSLLTIATATMLVVWWGFPSRGPGQVEVVVTPVGVSEFRPHAQRVYDERRWRQGVGDRSLLRALKSDALDAYALAKMRAVQRRQGRQFVRYRLYRHVARYRAPPGIGSGPLRPGDKRWWAIPVNVVCGESGYRFDPWENNDGGYQIIPSTWNSAAPGHFPDEAGDATPLQQHIIASQLWGTTPWYGSC